MKIDFDGPRSGTAARVRHEYLNSYVLSETDRLTDVILCPPDHLAAVPCCSVTRQHIDLGFVPCVEEALRQHAAFVMLLEKQGVRCHLVPPSDAHPDMCFTRDIGVATPWGMVALNPAMTHRQGEVEALLNTCARWGLPARRISRGLIEGGDICVARDGLLILGMSGERSSAEGIEEFATPFHVAGWDVLICPFHSDHLHLDTIFCMVDKNEAIGCVELLDPAFVFALKQHGISILPMPADLAGTLGCNILSLGGRRIIVSAADDIVPTRLRAAGYEVHATDVSQFAACGGGIHCLTQPMRRTAI